MKTHKSYKEAGDGAREKEHCFPAGANIGAKKHVNTDYNSHASHTHAHVHTHRYAHQGPQMVTRHH